MAPRISGINKSKFNDNEVGMPLFIPKRVTDIILDINHPLAKEFGGYDAIGTIFYTDPVEHQGQEKPNIKDFARPLFDFLKKYPLVNEIVMVLSSVGKQHYVSNNASVDYYLPNINIWNHPHHNALPDTPYLTDPDKEGKIEDFKMVEGGLVRTPNDDDDYEIKLGEYFKEKLDVQPLLPFEGDTIIEGRFGNSIRFGATAIEAKEKTAYSTKGETGDPITIIRNGQYIEEDRDRGWEHTIENINTDDSSIILTSNQVFPNFEIVSQHYQSWQTKIDYLDVSEAKDDFDNITLGSEPKEIKVEREEPTEEPEEQPVLEDDEIPEPVPEFVKVYDYWSGIEYEVTKSALKEKEDGSVQQSKEYTFLNLDFSNPAYELSQITSSAIVDVEAQAGDFLEEEASIYDLLIEQDNFEGAGFSWTVEDEMYGGATDTEKDSETESNEKDPEIDDNEAQSGDEDDTTEPPNNVDPPISGSEDDDSDPAKTEVSRETQEDGSIIITYSDGSTETIPAPLDPPKMVDEAPTPDAYVGDGVNLYVTTPITTPTNDFKPNNYKNYSGYSRDKSGGNLFYNGKIISLETTKEPHNNTGKRYFDPGSAGLGVGWRYGVNRNGRKFLIPPMTSFSTAINKWRYNADTNEAAHWTDKRTLSTPDNGGRGTETGWNNNGGVRGICIHTSDGAPKTDAALSAAQHIDTGKVWPSMGYNWTIAWDGQVCQLAPDHFRMCGSGVGRNDLGKAVPAEFGTGKGGDRGYVKHYDGTKLTNENTLQINWNGGGWNAVKPPRYAYGLAIKNFKSIYSYANKSPMYDIEKTNTGTNWHNLGSGRFGRVPGYGTMTDAQIKVMTNLIYIYIQRYPEVVFFGHNQQGTKKCPWFWVPTFMETILDLPDSPLKQDPQRYKDATYYYGGKDGKDFAQCSQRFNDDLSQHNSQDMAARAAGKKGMDGGELYYTGDLKYGG